MRSELVTQAAASVPSRFLLVHAARKITRAFHRPTKDRLPDTINDSLAGLAEGRYIITAAGKLISPGVPDLDCYNGITGEGQYSFVKPEFLTPDGEIDPVAAWGGKFEALAIPAETA